MEAVGCRAGYRPGLIMAEMRPSLPAALQQGRCAVWPSGSCWPGGRDAGVLNPDEVTFRMLDQSSAKGDKVQRLE
jgi:hypothetical protein